MAELRRALGLLDAIMVNVGVMIGSAVFLTASDVARAFPHPALQLGTWVVAALFSLAGALTIAELGARASSGVPLRTCIRDSALRRSPWSRRPWSPWPSSSPAGSSSC